MVTILCEACINNGANYLGKNLILMKDIISKSIKELNKVMPREKRLIIKDSTPLIDEKSKLESIDLVNLFVNLEKNLKEKDSLILTFDEIVENTEQLKTIGSLENFLVNKLKNEKK